MLFNSIQFLLFFPTVTLLYFLMPHKFRWILLLVASCLFYMTFIPVYILILIVTIVIDYFAGIYIEKSSGDKKKLYLIISIVSTCLVLFVFKYFNFFNSNMASIAKILHWNYSIGALSIILPIGLSFHTFQSLSYVIEVYRGKQKAEKNFGIYALYVMFYPQLVAGPIERPQNLLHQFYEKHEMEYERITDGLKQMLWGLFKKVVIADRLSILVNHVYGDPTKYQGIPLILATVFFAFQIYCDFSGYSDIAIGSAKVMGFKLMQNFNRPYSSKSISEFWKRWHISLSTWFKDYLYISLGGNRTSKWRWCFNLFITFVVSGFWHGANWTFIIWGALNGFYLVFSIWTQEMRAKLVSQIHLNRAPTVHKFIQISITFILVSFAWIFFRANNLSNAVYIVTHMFQGIDDSIGNIALTKKTILSLGLDSYNLIFAVFSIAAMEVIQYFLSRTEIIHQFSRKHLLIRWVCYYALIFTIIIFGVYGNAEKSQFIYFQF